MRFELFLTRLPRAALERIKQRLGELPPGVSPGLIFKGLENKRVPTVPVAYTDEKRAMNEIADTLLELGAEFRLVDHGNPLQKLGTLLAEKMGAPRYLEDEEQPLRNYKLRVASNKSMTEALIEHALHLLLQLVAVEILLVWFLGLRVGISNVGSLPGLAPLLLACAVGVSMAYATTACLKAVRMGRLKLWHASPVLACALACSVVSLFFLGSGFDSESDARVVTRPESKPYAGFLAELRKRKLAGELDGEHEASEPSGGQLEASDEAGDQGALLCEQQASAALVECQAGPDWDELAACFAQPVAVVESAPLARALEPEPVESKHNPRLSPGVVAPPIGVTTRASSGWQVIIEAADLLWLGGIWLLTAVGAFSYELALRRGRQPLLAAVEGQATEQPSPELASSGAAIDGDALSRLQYELTLARGESIASQAQLVDLSRQLGLGNERRQQLEQEVEQLRQQLSLAALQRRPETPSQAHEHIAPGALEGLARAQRPANDEQRVRRPLSRSDDDDGPVAVREDRVVLPKRRS